MWTARRVVVRRGWQETRSWRGVVQCACCRVASEFVLFSTAASYVPVEVSGCFIVCKSKRIAFIPDDAGTKGEGSYTQVNMAQ